MRYKVLWRHAGHGGNGEPFVVEADSLKKGFVTAVKIIKKGLRISRFVLTDIKCLVDENGISHTPGAFLR